MLSAGLSFHFVLAHATAEPQIRHTEVDIDRSAGRPIVGSQTASNGLRDSRPKDVGRRAPARHPTQTAGVR
jgi:hypothetical protein